jgi:hypothetical protein
VSPFERAAVSFCSRPDIRDSSKPAFREAHAKNRIALAPAFAQISRMKGSLLSARTDSGKSDAFTNSVGELTADHSEAV